jgi:hypothetical protein
VSFRFDFAPNEADNLIGMPNRTIKPKRRKLTEEQLIRKMERMAPSRETLRRLVKKFPAPQEWYDQDNSATNGPKKQIK